MSKRWKVRKANAAKLEHSREVTRQFYDSVIAELDRIKAMPPEERERLMRASKSESDFSDVTLADIFAQDDPNDSCIVRLPNGNLMRWPEKDVPPSLATSVVRCPLDVMNSLRTQPDRV